jgi:hypothetical protein
MPKARTVRECFAKRMKWLGKRLPPLCTMRAHSLEPEMRILPARPSSDRGLKPDPPEKCLDVADEEIGHFHRKEMAATIEL